MIEIGKKIRELREAKRMSQKELAEILNVTPQAVSKWELNKSYPDLDTLLKISKYFGVSTDDILGNAKKSFFETLFSKMEGRSDMEKSTNEPLPKAEAVSIVSGTLRIMFDNGVEKYLKSHPLAQATTATKKEEFKSIPTFLHTKITIEEDGTVVLNEEDRYTPEELWYESDLSINFQWGAFPFSH